MERRMISQLCIMDGMKKNSHVVVMAAASQPKSLDPAPRRFGTVDSKIDIGITDAIRQLEILRINKKNPKLDEDAVLEMVATKYASDT